MKPQDDSALMITVAPNGARKTKSDHPRLPISANELADTAKQCLHAGACMIHLHVRDEQNRHSLDSDRYLQAIAAIRGKVGDELIIQITTEAVGMYLPEQQMQVVRDVVPEAVSLAISELCPALEDEERAGEFFGWLQQQGIAAQYILYDINDIRRFNDLQQRGVVPHKQAMLLLVLGRYRNGQQSNIEDLEPLLREIKSDNQWSLCAFGASELACMDKAMSRGGHCRVGFENNLLMADGSVARGNESLVEQLVEISKSRNKVAITATEARKLINKY